ncbi:hypothetical protein PMAYCL1PPCAC_28347 [Pristionchus mayeri]|uniref:Fungal lipase-type domain-containing protein n=1 Tax=Pristionchus mayeri TaxID=1317129 RepID=A0AAN5I9X6_9BILA|nr:hypothetical protein PMAYCL1PPCAC_28347 [Pristionchus mayeri]
MRSLLFLPFLFSFSLAASFDDSTARNFMLPLSAAAYSDSPQTCLTQKLNGAKLSKQVTLKCDYFDDKCSGFTAVYDTKKVIILSFRGTSNTAQLVAEVQESGFEAKVDFIDGGQVSKYFNDAFMQLWNGGLGSDLQSLINKHTDYTLWVTGHSLGGALASLAAAHVAANNIIAGSKITLYTMGEPRNGDQTYANVHDNLLKTEYRITHLRDIVPHVPPQFMKYVHHKFEVFYQNDMAPGQPYTVCSEQEDKKCSDQYDFDTSVNDHTHYYGVEVSDFGKNGCK